MKKRQPFGYRFMKHNGNIKRIVIIQRLFMPMNNKSVLLLEKAVTTRSTWCLAISASMSAFAALSRWTGGINIAVIFSTCDYFLLILAKSLNSIKIY